MAIIPLTSVNQGDVQVVSWTGLTSSDTGQPLARSSFSDKCAQVVLVSGTVSSIIIQGSNDGTNYFTLTDPAGDDLSFTASGLKQITENPLYIRPSVTGGSTPSVTITIVAAKVG